MKIRGDPNNVILLPQKSTFSLKMPFSPSQFCDGGWPPFNKNFIWGGGGYFKPPRNPCLIFWFQTFYRLNLKTFSLSLHCPATKWAGIEIFIRATTSAGRPPTSTAWTTASTWNRTFANFLFYKTEFVFTVELPSLTELWFCPMLTQHCT